ncbi:MAG: 6-phosphofructokinase [Chloroflexi bacterium]|nr:6-phosphofructokinase [Chloroflexota bacterium]
MRKIGVLTSGGDAPGMNAAIRAVVRVSRSKGMEVVGVAMGFAGLVGGEMRALDERVVGGIIQHGGTVLGTARSEDFEREAGRRQALANLSAWGVEGLVVIGGDGSLRGAHALYEIGFPVVGVPATIDNDIPGTQIAIGVDTALNTVIQAVDRIKDTATSHHRAFIIEVMGRNCGYLALMAGMASGAEMVLIPEVETPVETVVDELTRAYARGKLHFIVIAAEGAALKAHHLRDYLGELEGGTFEARLTILGHIQRGGSPSAFDRILATRLGAAAVEELRKGASGTMVAYAGGKIASVDIMKAIGRRCGVDTGLYQLAKLLAK